MQIRSFIKKLTLVIFLFYAISQANAGILQMLIDKDINRPQLMFAIKAYEKNDYPKMMSLLIPLAERGYHPAQFILGCVYIDAVGMSSPNKELAILWLEKSTAQGNTEAEELLNQIKNQR